MRSIEIIVEAANVVKGTNCSNCTFSKGSKQEKVEESDLNSQGGLDTKDSKELKLAKEGDLVTLPGNETVTHKFKCHHPKIDQYVTEHMCCAYWDSPGTHRAFGKQSVGK